MKILVVNAGSSSVKYQVIDTKSGEVLTKGLCERIGIDGRHTNKTGKEKTVSEVPMKNHSEALKIVLEFIESDKVSSIKSLSEIDAVGHRVVHGGEIYKDSVLIDDEVLENLEKLTLLAPLHEPANISGIRACRELLPNVPQVAVFDTTFHATMPDYAYRYAIPKEAYTKWQIRKYGFHGTSHRFIAGELERLCGKKGNFIICHIGNGASLSAVKNGECVDTTMGYTPLEGVMMGSRSGDVDPSICERIMKETGMNITETINYLNKKSGLLGISGVSEDMRDVEAVAYGDPSDERVYDCKLGLKMHAYRVKKYVGAFYAVLGNVDAIAFTAGVGENGAAYRAEVLSNLEGMGIEIDDDRNDKNFVRGEINLISSDNSKVKVYVIPTDEEKMIAMDTERLSSRK